MALYAFDGTWNNEKDAGRYDLNTNVVRFKDLYSKTRYFYQGIGTRHGLIGKIVGGAFGVGGQERIQAAKKDLARQLAAGDRDIDIVGFSRGAALAVHFSNVIADGVTVNGLREVPRCVFSACSTSSPRLACPSISASASTASTSATSSGWRRSCSIAVTPSRSTKRARHSGRRVCRAATRCGSAASIPI